MEGTQQRSLVVQGLACVGNKYGGNTQCVIDDKHGARRVPCRIAAGLEGIADAAIGEARSVGFLLYQQLAREVFKHATFAIALHEGIVFLGCALGQRLEPMGIMGHTHFKCPFLHAGSHSIGYRTVQTGTVIHHVNHLFVDVLRQVLIHFLAVENVFAKELRRAFLGHFHFYGTFLERFLYNLES